MQYDTDNLHKTNNGIKIAEPLKNITYAGRASSYY